MEPGNVIIHHLLASQLTPHTQATAGGLALRYLGDDANVDDRPSMFLENQKVMKLLTDLKMEVGDQFEGQYFPRVWPK